MLIFCHDVTKYLQLKHACTAAFKKMAISKNRKSHIKKSQVEK